MIDLTKVSELKFDKVIEKIEDINGLVIYEAWKNLIASGVPPLTLLNCKGVDLVDYKVYGNSIQSRLPEEYQEVEYIESTGTQYIDTGVLLNQDSKLELLISHFDTSENRKIFGSRTSATSNNFSVVLGPVSGTMSIVTDFHNYQNNRLAYVINGDEVLDISISNEKLKINDLEKDITIYDNFETPSNAYLFNSSGTYPTGYTLSRMRLYLCKIYNNENLIRNFIPCYRKADNEVGLYDLVNNVFYTNAGTGTFTKGNNAPTPDNPIEIESVGDLVTNVSDENYGKYKIPIKITNENGENKTTNIYLDEPLRKIGDYVDYVDFEKGKVIRNVQEKTFNGSENWQQGSSMSTRFLLYDINDLKKDLSSNSRINIMSNYFEAISWENRNLITTNSIYTYVASSTMAIVITNSDTNTVNNFKEWLSVNNVKTYYPIATPIEEDIELPNIPTFKGTTILSVDTKVQPSNVEVVYKGK